MPDAPKAAPRDIPARGPAPRRVLAYRAALFFGIPLALFAALECGLRLGGYGRPASFLIPDDKPGYFRTNPDYASLFLPGNFDLRPLNIRIAARKAPNTVLSPHLGYCVKETWDGFYPQMIENALAFLDGKPVRVTNPEVLQG